MGTLTTIAIGKGITNNLYKLEDGRKRQEKH